jgi:GxxExxY protein
MEKEEIEKLINKIIGCCIDIHKELGPGFLESIYHKALEIRFSPRAINKRKDNGKIEKRYITRGKEEGIKFESEKEIAVSFHKKFIGIHRLDFLVEKEIVLELKTVKEIHKKYYAQVRSYLKAVNKDIGLLTNFSDFKLDPRRVERTWR